MKHDRKTFRKLDLVKRLRSEILGQDLVEYALAAGLIAVAAVAAMPPLKNTINTVFSKIVTIIEAKVI